LRRLMSFSLPAVR